MRSALLTLLSALLAVAWDSRAVAQQQVVDELIGFSVIIPLGWKEIPEPSVSRAFASASGDRVCTIKRTEDDDLAIIGIDGYINEFTPEKIESLLRIVLTDPEVHLSSPTQLAGRKGVMYLHSGWIEGEKIATATFQTISGRVSYTLNCFCAADAFNEHYPEFLAVARSLDLK